MTEIPTPAESLQCNRTCELKFPLFSSGKEAFWLAQVEAFFRVAQITNQRERFDYVLSHVDPDSNLRMVMGNAIYKITQNDDKAPWDVLKNTYIEYFGIRKGDYLLLLSNIL